jgi:outer membrane protein assembly complex protein YaeT
MKRCAAQRSDLPRVRPATRTMTALALALALGAGLSASAGAGQVGGQPVAAQEPAARAQPPDPGQADARAEARARRRFRVTRVRFTGVTAVSTGALASALATRASSRLPWGTKRYYSRAELLLDLRRIRAFYADRGYPRARVDRYDVNVRGRERVSVTFHIIEGPPVRLAAVEYFGFEALPPLVFANLQKNLGLAPGATRTRVKLNDAQATAENAFKEEGYPYARVSALEGAGREPLTVSVTLAAEPGTAAKFGPVTLVGNSSVSDRVITRYLAFGPGDVFKLSRVLESQRRLYNLELFQYVNFTVPDLAAQPVEVPVTATVTEGKHRRVQVGLGYGSEEKARGTLRWRHVNFFGGARTLGIETKWSSLDRGVRLNFSEPYFLSPSYKFDASIQQWRAKEPAFELLTRGGRASITREILRRDSYGRRRSVTRAGLSIIDEHENYTITPEALADPTFRDELIAQGLDPETSKGRGTLVAIGLDLTHDTTDTLLDAQRGYVASLHLERAATAFGGDWSYFEATFDGRQYWKMGPWGLLANRIRIGSLDPNGRIVPVGAEGAQTQAGVPFFKRYFLGGASSLRGWGRYEVSPLNTAGFPIGGLSTLEIASEVRFPIRGRLTGVTFIEGGVVSLEPWRFPRSDLRYDAGTGLRYLTPIGPIRFDVGYQLNPIPGLLIDGAKQTRRWRLHFSVGQAF